MHHGIWGQRELVITFRLIHKECSEDQDLTSIGNSSPHPVRTDLKEDEKVSSGRSSLVCSSRSWSGQAFAKSRTCHKKLPSSSSKHLP
jgi:hypothetical protein